MIREWWRRWKEAHPPRPFLVCVDPVREIMCESLTAEEWHAHLLEQRRIDEFVRRRRCGDELDKSCV